MTCSFRLSVRLTAFSPPVSLNGSFKQSYLPLRTRSDRLATLGTLYIILPFVITPKYSVKNQKEGPYGENERINRRQVHFPEKNITQEHIRTYPNGSAS